MVKLNQRTNGPVNAHLTIGHNNENIFEQGQLTLSQWSDLTEIRTHPSFNACSYYLKVSKRLE